MALDWITIKDIFKMLYWALSLAIFSRRPFSVMINKVNAHIESNKLTCFSDIFMIFSDIIHVTFSLIGGVVSEPWYVQYDVISIRKITSVKSGCNDYFRILEIADVKEKIRRPKYACANFFFQSCNKLYLYSFVVFLLSAVSKQARNKVGSVLSVCLSLKKSHSIKYLFVFKFSLISRSKESYSITTSCHPIKYIVEQINCVFPPSVRRRDNLLPWITSDLSSCPFLGCFRYT